MRLKETTNLSVTTLCNKVLLSQYCLSLPVSRIHHNHLVTQTDLLAVFDDLRRVVPRGLDDLRVIFLFPQFGRERSAVFHSLDFSRR